MLAGKEILKTVRVQDARIVDETNLRAAVLNYADSHPRQRDGMGIHDVKWSHGQFNSHIATAAANGKVILYDLNRASVELTRLHEHTRQVHKLAFNPHQGHLLLSASHDTTVRMWDLRDMRRDVTTCRSRDQYPGINGGIRDVQWSPTDAVEFAFGTDNGTIQRWDFRYNKGPKQKITAHDQRICTSIDWHPDGKHLLSAGVDRTVKVWDFSITGRRQKPAWVLHTPYPVYQAKWRPPYWSDEFHEKGAYQCTQLATSYDREHPVIHVWDFRRPHLPFREINRFQTAPSCMLWHSRDTLWTVGKEGIFQQNDVHHAPKTVDRRNLQALAVSPSGEIGGVAQKRPRRRASAGLAYPDDTYVGDPRDRRSSPEKTSLRSSADDTLDDSFLASSMKRHHGRTASNRSTKSFSSTPPSDTAPKVMFLTGSMATQSESFRPTQAAFRGALPGVANTQTFAYLAQKYKAIALPDPPDVDSFLHVNSIFEQNAEYAERAALYRLAQSWRVAGASIAVATRRRAEMHRAQRKQRAQPTSRAVSNGMHDLSLSLSESSNTPSAVPPNPAVRAILGTFDKSQATSPAVRLPVIVESTSNITTPLARPQNGSSCMTNDLHHLVLPDIDQIHIDQLPPAVSGTPSGQSTFNGPQWYQAADGLDERRALVGSYRASPRIPLTFDSRSAPGASINVPPPLERHDSGESFTMFSASTDSQKGGSIPSSFASVDSLSRSVGSLSDNWQTTEERSSFGKPRTDHLQDEQHESEQAQVSPTTMPINTQRQDQLDPLHNEGEIAMSFGSEERVAQKMENLRRNNQLLRHDSSESDTYASTSTSSFDYSIDMEASGTIIPASHETLDSPRNMSPPAFSQHRASIVPHEPIPDDILTLADFQAQDFVIEEVSAYSVIGLLEQLLAYHANASDAQFTSFLILLLAPLLPTTQSQSSLRDFNIEDFTDTFISMGLSLTQAKALLSTQLNQLISMGINPYQAEAVISTYHAQLHSLSLFNSAASLRRLSYPTYPAVYEQALKDTQIGLLCLSCKAPINNPVDKMRCESCRRSQAPCPICWGKYAAFEPITSKKKAKSKSRSNGGHPDHKRKRSSIMSHQVLDAHATENSLSPAMPTDWSPLASILWTWCPLCGHGGHSNCLSTWFADTLLSDGACATEGCLCDCVQGKRRYDKMQELARKKAQKERAKVVRKGDDWKVDESRAVSAVRTAALHSTPEPIMP